MKATEIAAQLHTWEYFFMTGEDIGSDAGAASLDTLIALARQSGDSYLIAQAELCEALETVWMNGARHAETEAAEAAPMTAGEFVELARLVCSPAAH